MTLLGGFFQGRSSTLTLYGLFILVLRPLWTRVLTPLWTFSFSPYIRNLCGLFGFSPYAWSQSIFGRVRRSFERGCRDLAAGDQISAEMTRLGGFFQGRSSTPTLYGLFILVLRPLWTRVLTPLWTFSFSPYIRNLCGLFGFSPLLDPYGLETLYLRGRLPQLV